MTLSAEFAGEYIHALPITPHVSHHLDGIYCVDRPKKCDLKYHREELKHHRV